MKKIISLLLALLMAFSVVTVAFANGDETTAEQPDTTLSDENNTTEEETPEGALDLGEFQWILDLPFWTVGPALKFAKIAFKLVSAYLKVAKIFGLVEQDMGDMILGAILDMIENSQNAENGEEVTTTVAAEESTVAA